MATVRGYKHQYLLHPDEDIVTQKHKDDGGTRLKS